MATASASPIAAESAREPLPQPERIILHDVPWDAYVAINSERANWQLRMTYLDGTLELMSPQYRHDKNADRLGIIVQILTEVFDLPSACARSTTLRRKGRGKKKGLGKEPDNSFYLANEHLIRDNEQIDLRVDPPPDLIIEVDNTADSDWKLPVYARLGVPEVWRLDLDAGTLLFGQLQAGGSYAPVERSVVLPMLTPRWVLDVLGRCHGIGETRWRRQLRDWVREELVPPPAP